MYVCLSVSFVIICFSIIYDVSFTIPRSLYTNEKPHWKARRKGKSAVARHLPTKKQKGSHPWEHTTGAEKCACKRKQGKERRQRVAEKRSNLTTCD